MQLRSALLCGTALWCVSPASAQAPVPATKPAEDSLQFTVGGLQVRRWNDGGVVRAALRRPGESTWRPLAAPEDRLHFLAGAFDPLREAVTLSGPLAAPAGTRLFVVQFHTQVLAEYRDAVSALGGELLCFMPANALYVRADNAVAGAIAKLPCVRWVGPLQNGHKLDNTLRTFVTAAAGALDVNLVLARKTDRERLVALVGDAGAVVTDRAEGSVLLRAKVTPAQLVTLLASDAVVWADPVTEVGFDMDNARIQGGGDYIESIGNYRGQGVRAEITEYFQETHPDFAGRAIVRGTNSVASHGHCTAGIVAGAGANNFAARGMMPECTVIEGGYTNAANHYVQIQGSVSPSWRAMQATASWGSATTANYTSVSLAMDDALFDFDFVRTQSQSNTGTTASRPEAWAKNMISVGGVRHLDTATPLDDYWGGGGSTGPATDGRLKPDICAYYDNVLTSDRTGTSGYASGDYYAAFSGTSSATPIVNGHVGLMQQLFTDGLFGNPLPLPANDQNRFDNRAHAATMKALLCNTAEQYTFSGASHDLARVHQGWGFPSLSRLYDHRNSIVVLDEYDTLQVTQARDYLVWIAPGTPELRATMVYADPPANAGAAVQLVCDANLKVTRLADGLSWWGNNGLDADMFSTSGGSPNDRDNIECVYLQNPAAGLYSVRVEAASVPQDAKVETPQVDMDFALVMHPMGGGYRVDSGLQLDLSSSGPGDLTMTAANVPANWTEGFTALSFGTSRGLGFGNFLGVEPDAITVALWTSAAAPGNPFHFPNVAGAFPNAPFVFPAPGIISALAGLTVDAVTVLFQGGDVVAVSNVDRLTLQ